ncbi:MAG: penicillin-binding protein activator LpoB [Phycisphaerales bacterium]|nr:penicillin-binding protein activator LpoB [Phycisphaerales bacterium]
MIPTRVLRTCSLALAVTLPSMTAMADLGLEFHMPVLAGLNDPVVEQETLTIQEPEAVTEVTPPGFSSPVTQAASPQDAINAASRNLQSVETDGATWIEIDGQLGVVATGSSSWDPELANPQLRLREQRLAWMTASLNARTAMARFVEGVSVAGQERLADELTTRDTETLSGIESRREGTEEISSTASAVLRGAVLYELDEDASAGRVTVTLVSTPATQGLTQARGSGIAGARNLAHARDIMIAELRSGVVPPTGGRLLETADGTRAWIAFGADTVAPGRTGRLRQVEMENARRTARLRAERAMVAILEGESIAEDDVLDARYEEVMSQTDDLLARTSDTETQRLSEQATESTRRSVASGAVPPGVDSVSLESPDGTWQYVMLVHGIEREPAAAPPARLPGPSVPSGTPQATPSQPSAPAPPRTPTQQPAPPTPPAEMPAPPSAPSAVPPGSAPPAAPQQQGAGNRIVEAAGTGATRELAIKNALLEAVSMVNGTLVNGETIASQKYKDAIEDFNGRANRRTSSDSLSNESIRTTSSGLVSSYAIISEGPLAENAAERAHGDTFAVRIRADVPVFDPSTPRAGGRPTIAVLPLRVAKISLPADEQRISNNRVANYFTAIVNRDLVRDRTFTVLDEKYLRALDSKRAEMLDRIQDGRADNREILKFGRELTADYVLVGTLEDLTFKKWRQYVKLRDVYENRQQLTVDLEMRLINISTGAVEWMDHYSNDWNSVQLAQRRGEDRTLSPTRFAMVKAGEAIEASLMDYIRSRKKD